MKKKQKPYEILRAKSDAFILSLGLFFLVGAVSLLMQDRIVLGALEASISRPTITPGDSSSPTLNIYIPVINQQIELQTTSQLSQSSFIPFDSNTKCTIGNRQCITLNQTYQKLYSSISNKCDSGIFVPYTSPVTRFINTVQQYTVGGIALLSTTPDTDIEKDWDELVAFFEAYKKSLKENNPRSPIERQEIVGRASAFFAAFNAYFKKHGGRLPTTPLPNPKEGKITKDWQEKLEKTGKRMQEELEKSKEMDSGLGEAMRNGFVECPKPKIETAPVSPR